MESLKFNVKEMAAILKMVKAMIMADGVVDSNEKNFLGYLLHNLGINENDPVIFYLSDAMEFDIAIATIKNMSSSQKRYFTAYLGVMIAIDEDIDKEEVALWKMISILCNLPTMTINEAVKEAHEYMIAKN